jgi:hypothetical protein
MGESAGLQVAKDFEVDARVCVRRGLPSILMTRCLLRAQDRHRARPEDPDDSIHGYVREGPRRSDLPRESVGVPFGSFAHREQNALVQHGDLGQGSWSGQQVVCLDYSKDVVSFGRYEYGARVGFDASRPVEGPSLLRVRFQHARREIAGGRRMPSGRGRCGVQGRLLSRSPTGL